MDVIWFSNALAYGGALVSVLWFFLAHFFSFFALGMIVKKKHLGLAARASSIITAVWLVLTALVVSFAYFTGFGSSPGSMAVLFVVAMIAPIVYLVCITMIGMRSYELSRGYAMLAAFLIGLAYLIVTVIVSVIVQMLFVFIALTFMTL